MNFHLFTVIIVYILILSISHILIKNNVTIQKNIIKVDIVKDDPVLHNINDFDESNIRNELMSYFDSEKQDREKQLSNFLKNTPDDTIKAGNFFTPESNSNFIGEQSNIHDNFNIENNDKYSFDPVPTKIDEMKTDNQDAITSGGIINYTPNDTLFGTVQAFDDFDMSYANI